LRGGRSAYPLVVGTIRSALAQEREMGGGAQPEGGSDGLTLIGQFAGRLGGTSPRSCSSFSAISGRRRA
jgi:DNA mismatch repair protein MutL